MNKTRGRLNPTKRPTALTWELDPDISNVYPLVDYLKIFNSSSCLKGPLARTVKLQKQSNAALRLHKH
jgi:hypothetical protein